MIKNLLLLTTLFFTLQLTNINAQSYNFSHTTSTYTDLTSPTIVSSPSWDGFTSYSTVLPFQFEFYGQSFDTIWYFGDFASFTSSMSQYNIGFYLYAGITDNSTHSATISYQTTGSAPNRIFIIQVKNAGFSNNFNGSDYTNYQLWLYESSNVLEMHYGPNSVLDPSIWQIPGTAGPGISVYVNSNNGISLSGSYSNPTLIPNAHVNTIDSVPANGIVYQFTPTITGINENINNVSFSVYPNPSNGNVTIHSKDLSFDGDLNVYDVSGKRVHHNSVSFIYSTSIDLSLTPGIYFAELNDGNAIVRTKLVIE